MRRAVAEALTTFSSRTALIVESGEVWSYARLEADSRAVAEKLPIGSLVAIEGTNCPATIAAYLGVLLSGGLAHFTEPGRIGHLRSTFGSVTRIVCDSATATIEPDAGAGGREAIHPDLVLLFSTSGTTGASKFAKITANNIRSNTESIIAYLELSENDRAITSLKPGYTFGLSVINTHLLCGGALLLTDRSIQEPGFWDFARTAGATSIAGVPHTFEVLANDDRLESVPTLRQLTQAGGKLRPELVRHFAGRGHRAGWRFYVMYGQTEASPRIAYLPPAMAETAPEAIGVAIPGGELTIENEIGQVIEAPGVEGELIYRGPNVMAGYASARADLLSASALESLRTGDLAIRRPDGLFVVTGRRSRFIKPLGRRIALDDVEQMLARRGIRACAVAQGESLLIVNEGAEAVPAGELAAELELPRIMVTTRHVVALPRLSSGKVDYMALEKVTPRRAWLPAHLPAFVRDTAIEAWSLLTGGASQSRSVAEIFVSVLGPVTPDDSFVSLGADSMSYVQLSIALEDVFGKLPPGWTRMTVGELDKRCSLSP